MSLKAKCSITLNYLKNALEMILANSISLCLAIFLLFSVSNLSHILIVHIASQEEKTYLLRLNHSGSQGLSTQDLIQINHLFHGEVVIQELVVNNTFNAQLEDGLEIEISLESLALTHKYQSFVIVSNAWANKYEVHPGERMVIGSQIFRVLDVLDLDNENEAWISEKYLLDLRGGERFVSEDLILRTQDEAVVESVLDFINQNLTSPGIVYQYEELDLNDIMISLLTISRNFLYFISGLIFFVSIFMVRNVVVISAMERKDELIVLRSFGLSETEIEELLVMEVITLICFTSLLSLMLSLILSVSFSWLLSVNFRLNILSLLLIFGSVLVLGYLNALLSARRLNKLDINDLD